MSESKDHKDIGFSFAANDEPTSSEVNNFRLLFDSTWSRRNVRSIFVAWDRESYEHFCQSSAASDANR